MCDPGKRISHGRFVFLSVLFCKSKEMKTLYSVQRRTDFRYCIMKKYLQQVSGTEGLHAGCGPMQKRGFLADGKNGCACAAL